MHDDRSTRPIVVITGGRDRTPTLAELEQLEQQLVDFGAERIRHGACPARKNKRGELVGSTDTLVAGYLRARGWAVEPWPADWRTHGRAAGPLRNRAMISGRRPGEFVAIPASTVVAFEGGVGTLDCRVAGYEAGIAVHHVWPVAEPRVWNRHHGKPPGPAIYCGEGTPVGNPWRDLKREPGQSRADAAVPVLARYRAWLWERLETDPAVLRYLRELTPEHYAVCSCWPAHCHVQIVIEAWRKFVGQAWNQERGRR